VQQPADQRALAVIDAAAGNEAQELALIEIYSFHGCHYTLFISSTTGTIGTFGTIGTLARFQPFQQFQGFQTL
jgi:hypothetical protein